ncbi:MAG: hypothetical protein ACXVAM_02465 [Vulcanimicrobiaceae bacterium]
MVPSEAWNQPRKPRKRDTAITRPCVFTLGLCIAAALAVRTPALGDQRYVVTGNDSYQIGRSDLQTQISYAGTQQLTIVRQGKLTRFTAKVQYTRTDQGGPAPAHATFVQEMMPTGELQDRADADPDYLTVLNQPFAIQLDEQTLQDLAHLHGRVPFKFPSPITGGSLQGYLLRASIARVASKPAIGVGFDATGPMVGPLPDHPNISIAGKMRMQGTAYYAVHGALLLALDETLTITGTLNDRSQKTPVTIVYKRSIRADAPRSMQTQAQAHSRAN